MTRKFFFPRVSVHCFYSFYKVGVAIELYVEKSPYYFAIRLKTTASLVTGWFVDLHVRLDFQNYSYVLTELSSSSVLFFLKTMTSIFKMPLKCISSKV